MQVEYLIVIGSLVSLLAPVILIIGNMKRGLQDRKYWTEKRHSLMQKRPADEASKLPETPVPVLKSSSPKRFIALDFDATYGYRRDALDLYFNTLVHYVDKAESVIRVLDYLPEAYMVDQVMYQLEKNKETSESAKHLHQSYERYFRALEKKVCEGVSYKRILQLSVQRDGKEDYTKHDLLVQALLSAKHETVHHFSRLRELPEKHHHNFNLYVIKEALRLHSFMVIDDQYILTEYERRDKTGKTFPDSLFVNTNDSEPGLLFINHATRQFDRLANAIEKREKEVFKEEYDRALKNVEEKADTIRDEGELNLLKVPDRIKSLSLEEV